MLVVVLRVDIERAIPITGNRRQKRVEVGVCMLELMYVGEAEREKGNDHEILLWDHGIRALMLPESCAQW